MTNSAGTDIQVSLDLNPTAGRVLSWSGNLRRSCCVVLIHGAGLEPTHPLYISIAEHISPQTDVWIPFLTASQFLSFPRDFRKPSGWAVHDPDVAVREVANWVSVAESRYDHVLLFGHSWGAYVAARAAPHSALFLASPIPDLRSIVDTNFDGHAYDKSSPEFLTCRPGAPFPFLSRRTLDLLVEHDKSISELLASNGCDIQVVYGGKEHSLISKWLDNWPVPSNVTLKTIAGAGHFYGMNGALLSPLVLSMISSHDAAR